MLVSMTGFGSATFLDEHLAIKTEIRSVNHRYLDIVVRVPKGYAELEERIRRLAAEYIFRGRLEIFVSLEEFGEGKRTVHLDEALLTEYVRAFEKAETVLQRQLVPTVDTLVGLADLFVITDQERDIDATWTRLGPVLNEAFEKLVAMRQAEGKHLESEIRQRLQHLENILDDIGCRAPENVENYHALLTRRVNELLDTPPVDEQRIAQEIALYADKVNIDEELTRARSHIQQVVQTCQVQGSVGRKLDFLIQELNREVNTIGSKAQDGLIANLVVEAKSELEKIREQVQNVE